MKTIIFLIYCLSASHVYASLGSILNIDSPIFLLPEDQDDVDFGFSLSLFTNQTHRNVLVGSPLANTSQAGVTSPGALYSCDISNIERTKIYCSQLSVDTRNKDDKYISFIDEDLKDFQRLGGSLSAAGNHVVVCAPNWHYYERRVRATNDAPVGLCFKSSSLEKFEPFSVPYDQNADSVVIDYLNYGSCQSGFSSTLSKDKKMILGSPGCFNWEGDVYAETENDFLSFGKSFTAENFGGARDGETLWLPNMYMGYSVAAGYFKGMKGIAVGIPKSSHVKKGINSTYGGSSRVMNPMITVHIIENDELKLWTILAPPKNEDGSFDSVWLFSYFGYSVAVADIDGNGLDDIIVGAPFYHNETSFDQGAILIYQQVKEVRENASDIYHMFLEKDKSFRSATNDYGRFGSSVVNAGDLDANGIEDIAVGAPYGEDGRVFIYLGTSEGLSETPYQIISSSDYALQGRNLKGFGSSFAPSFQVEEGTQMDMAVGAFISDTAVIFMKERRYGTQRI